MSNMVFAHIEFTRQLFQRQILIQMSLDIGYQILIQTLLFFLAAGVVLFIDNPVQMKHQVIDAETYFRFPSVPAGMNFFQKLEHFRLDGIEGNPVIVKNIIPGQKNMLH